MLHVLNTVWSRVGWLCLCVTIVSGLGVAGLWKAVDTLLDHEIETAIQEHASARAYTWSRQFFRTVTNSAEIFRTRTVAQDEIQRFQDSLSISEVVRFRLYTPEGETVHLFGDAIFAHDMMDPELAKAVFLSGEHITRIHRNTGVTALPALPATYVRTMIPATTLGGERIGAIEAYIDTTALEATLEKAFARATAYLIAGTVIVMALPGAAFFWRNTQTMKKDRELLELSRYDQLTGVLNRNSVSERLDLLFSQGHARKRLGLLFVDLDYFKQVNDSHGHHVGDLLLAHVADILKAHIRSKDDIVARYGGDEFLVLLPGIDAAELMAVSHRILRAANAPVRLDGVQLTPSLSIGAYVAGASDTQRAALHRADLAVYAAKANGRDQVVAYGPDLEHKRKMADAV
ncbi:GGDEF domain-containing protein [Roseibium aquae]|uniref:GGDEF domain-containing protein n=1 Tax=Roseibium aquae TaxID=1323746 RepID=A0A916TMC9_9HYPH|nr:GGDEF domain-containing protein [Roseibium aquae]GGB54843.1 GGDEF domain-containing protein [Roseibium aquae]